MAMMMMIMIMVSSLINSESYLFHHMVSSLGNKVNNTLLMMMMMTYPLPSHLDPFFRDFKTGLVKGERIGTEMMVMTMMLMMVTMMMMLTMLIFRPWVNRGAHRTGGFVDFPPVPEGACRSL